MRACTVASDAAVLATEPASAHRARQDRHGRCRRRPARACSRARRATASGARSAWSPARRARISVERRRARATRSSMRCGARCRTASPTSCSSCPAPIARTSSACCSASRRNAACRSARSSIRRLRPACGRIRTAQLMYVDAGFHRASVTRARAGRRSAGARGARARQGARRARGRVRAAHRGSVRCARRASIRSRTRRRSSCCTTAWRRGSRTLQREERVELKLEYRGEEFRVVGGARGRARRRRTASAAR